MLFCSPNEWLVEKIFPKAQPGLTWRKRGGPFFWGALGFLLPLFTSLAGRVQGRYPSPSPASPPLVVTGSRPRSFLQVSFSRDIYFYPHVFLSCRPVVTSKKACGEKIWLGAESFPLRSFAFLFPFPWDVGGLGKRKLAEARVFVLLWVQRLPMVHRPEGIQPWWGCRGKGQARGNSPP